MNRLTAESPDTAELKEELKESGYMNTHETYLELHPEQHLEGCQNVNSSQTSTNRSEGDDQKECQHPCDSVASTDPQADQQTDDDNPDLQEFIDEDFDNIDTWL